MPRRTQQPRETQELAGKEQRAAARGRFLQQTPWGSQGMQGMERGRSPGAAEKCLCRLSPGGTCLPREPGDHGSQEGRRERVGKPRSPQAPLPAGVTSAGALGALSLAFPKRNTVTFTSPPVSPKPPHGSSGRGDALSEVPRPRRTSPQRL